MSQSQKGKYINTKKAATVILVVSLLFYIYMKTHFNFILVNTKYVTKYLLHEHGGNFHNLSSFFFSPKGSGRFFTCKRNPLFFILQVKLRALHFLDTDQLAAQYFFFLPAQRRENYERELSGHSQMVEINVALVPLPSLIIAALNDARP